MIKTWTQEDIYRAIAAALLAEDCPQCPKLLDKGGARAPAAIETCGPWTLSVGPSDVMVTVHSVCAASHRFILVVSLWHRAKTPASPLKIKDKIEMTPPARPRPLAGI